MLKLYTDTSFLNENNRAMVFPLLFDLHFKKSTILDKFYAIVNHVNNADIVVFPVDYSRFIGYKKASINLITQARACNKPIWIYTAGDFGFTVHIPNSYTFRLGGFNSKLKDTTFILPSFIDNPYQTILKQRFSTILKEHKPTIGFVGHANSGVINYFKSYLSYLKLNVKFLIKPKYFDTQKFYPSSNIRYSYLKILNKSNQLKTNFVFRDKYRAGVSNNLDKSKTAKVFYTNIFNNLYTFCIRGVGNFSVRFYETLAVGRIPILLDTDCRLPLEDDIQWRNHIIILDISLKASLEEQILRFHTSKSEEALTKIQDSNKLLWETHLRRHSYFVKIHDKFLNTKNNV